MFRPFNCSALVCILILAGAVHAQVTSGAKQSVADSTGGADPTTKLSNPVADLISVPLH